MNSHISKTINLAQNESYNQYKNAILEFEQYRNKILPLCAAENIISEFSKQPLMFGLQERYILDGYLNYNEETNMIGSKKLFPFYDIVNSQCKDLFGALYTDCRSLSGMNALQNILLSLTKKGDMVMILSPESGGHAALPNILGKLGINYIEAPFDYDEIDYAYREINKLLNERNIDFILFAPTDIIFLPDFKKFKIPLKTKVIFDASQILAYYINNQGKNPLSLKSRVILLGGTHKTIPGVAKSLIMTNDEELAEEIDKTINPLYLRNTHMQNVASLILTLIEMEYYAKDYCLDMSANSNYLGGKLQQFGLDIINRKGVFSETHQLFIHMSKKDVDDFYKLSNQFGISLNKKVKRLFKGNGIRLGVQEITRYGWDKEEMDIVAQILYLIYRKETKDIPKLLESFKGKKKVQYTFKEGKCND